jgi:serine/threonine protein phosphatase PrpC
MNCPKCQTAAKADSNFCEECGTQLQAVAAPALKSNDLCACGAGPEMINEDGFCDVCGLQRRKACQDHAEIEHSPLMAGVSDLGKRHGQNEDSFCLHEEQDVRIAVVCDGVSMSENPDEASHAAAQAAQDSLVASARLAAPDFKVEMREAIARAAVAVAQLGVTPIGVELDPPSSTIVAAIVPAPVANQPRKAIVGWVGDSRAYYISDKSCLQLTKDHSWLNETVDLGEIPYEQAIKDKRSHHLTRTLGGMPEKPSTEMDEPGIVEVDLNTTGWLLLCTDGLWNYAASTEDLAKIFRTIPKTATALEICQFLTGWANQQGGKDNVTVLALAV